MLPDFFLEYKIIFPQILHVPRGAVETQHMLYVETQHMGLLCPPVGIMHIN